MKKFIQRLGKSMLLPISVLPVCGILLGIGYLICPEALQSGQIHGFFKTLGFLLVKTGSGIIDHMSLLFVLGVSLGLSDDNHGASCVAGLVSWLTVTTLLALGTMETVLPDMTENFAVAFSKIENPFIGILTGVIGAECYNHFRGMTLPKAVGFFSGRRFVAIITVFISVGVSAVLTVAWPWLFSGMVLLGQGILKLKGFGAGIYVFLNRALIPLGLHHALNSVFLFDTVGIGDLTAFWAGKTGAEVGWSLGMYMSPYFPCMIFGIPGAALALYHASGKKKKVAGIMFTAALCAVICGITEPFEFAFMFLAFPLYIIYALLYGLFGVITYYSGFRAGFSLSGGLIDLVFSASLPAAEKTWLILPLGILAFAVFYLVFRVAIRVFRWDIFGDEEEEASVTFSAGNADRIVARRMLAAVGGASNVVGADCCATRLRLELAETDRVDRAAVKAGGALAFVPVDKNNAQIVIGPNVQQVYEAFCEEWQRSLHDRQRVQHGQMVFPAASGPVRYVLRDPIGIHARPAGALAALLRAIPDCTVTIRANGKTASGTSLTEIMALGAVQGTELTVEASGRNAAQALHTAETYLKTNL